MDLNGVLKKGYKLYQKKKYIKAIKTIEPLLKIKKNFYSAWYILALCYKSLGEFKQAQKAFEYSQYAYKDDANWHIEFGNILNKIFELKKAKEICNKAIELDSNHKNIIWAWNCLGVIAMRTNNIEEGLFNYKKAYDINPKDLGICNNLGETYILHKEPLKAKKIFVKALQVAEELGSSEKISLARMRLARVEHFELNGTPEEALKYLRPLLPLKENLYKSSIANLTASLKLKQNEWSYIKELTLYIKQGIENKTVGLQNPFNALSLYGLSEIEHRKIAERSMREGGDFREKRVKPFSSKKIKPLNNRPLRIGVLSSDLLHTHPVHNVSKYILKLLANQKDIELYIYSTSKEKRDNSYKYYLKKLYEITTFLYDVTQANGEAIAKQIYLNEIDILVDFNGHTKGGRLDVYAYRPAPVIVNWLGYPSTMGGEWHDWIIADKYVIPKTSESAFTEKVWRLPVTYFPTDNTQPIPTGKLKRVDFGLPKEKFVFASFNNSNKINANVFDVWCKILLEVKDSILWLRDFKETSIERLRDEAEKRGVEPSRLIFAGFTPDPKEYHELIGLADLALDSWPYNLHATAVDFLWAGIPVLTLKGETFAGRVGESLLNAVGLPELVAKDRDEYIAKAVSLARNSKQIQRLKERVKEARTSSALFDSERMAQDLKDAFIGMYQEAFKNQKSTNSIPHKKKEQKYNYSEELRELWPKVQKAQALHAKGESTKALAILDAILRFIPDAHPVLLIKSLLMRDIKEDKEADKLLQKASVGLQENPLYLITQGNRSYGLEEFDLARESFQKLLKIAEPKKHQKWIGEAYYSLGAIYTQAKEYHKAKEYLLKAEPYKKESIDYWMTLTTTLINLEEFSMALQTSQMGLRIDVNNENLLIQYNQILIELKEYEKLFKFLTALITKPSAKELKYYSLFLNSLFSIKLEINSWQEIERYEDELLYFVKKDNSYYNDIDFLIQPMALFNGANSASEADLLSCATKITNYWLKEHRYFLDKNREKNFTIKDRLPLKIGFVSSDLHNNHPVGKVLQNTLKHIDSNICQLHIYSTNKKLTKSDKIESLDKIFIDVGDKTPLEIVQKIQRDKIDILIDLNGYTKGHNIEVFLARPAPVIVNWLGYPGSMGSDKYDWILADEFVIPKESETYYTEKVWRLPKSYMPTDGNVFIETKFKREDFDLPKDKFIFACFNNNKKINPSVLNAWVKILKSVPQSIIWLNKIRPIAKKNLLNEFALRGIDSNRVIFASKVEEMSEHLTRLQLADLALDTWSYNMHATGVDMLQAGVPILTLKGKTFASRVGESLLNAIEMPDMVAPDIETYIEMAVDIANHPNKLMALKDRVKESHTHSALFDSKKMARSLEEAFMGMYETTTKQKLKG